MGVFANIVAKSAAPSGGGVFASAAQDQAKPPSGIQGVAQGAAKGSIKGIAQGLSGLTSLGGTIESGLDQTLGRVGNIVTGKGNIPTNTAQGAKTAATAIDTFANQPGLHSNGTAENVGDVIGQAADLTIGPPGKLVSKGAELASETGGKVVSDIAAARAASTAEKENAKIVDMVSPKLSPTETARAIARKDVGTTNTGVLGNIKLGVDATAQKIGDTVKKYVPDLNLKGSISDNIEKIKTAAYDSVKQLASQVEKDGRNIAIPLREVASKIDNAIKDPAIKIALQDSGYERRVASLKDEAMNIMRKNGGNPSGILQSTKEFDNLVERVFPHLYDKEFSSARSAVKVIRDAMSDAVDKALPDTAYRAARQEQSRLFSAIENMSEKAVGEIGTNTIQRSIENNPLVKGAVGVAKKAIPFGIGSHL